MTCDSTLIKFSVEPFGSSRAEWPLKVPDLGTAGPITISWPLERDVTLGDATFSFHSHHLKELAAKEWITASLSAAVGVSSSFLKGFWAVHPSIRQHTATIFNCYHWQINWIHSKKYTVTRPGLSPGKSCHGTGCDAQVLDNRVLDSYRKEFTKESGWK